MPKVAVERIPRRFVCTNCGNIFQAKLHLSVTPAACPICDGDAYAEYPSGQGAVTVLDDPGRLANAILRASSDYAANETITIGADVFVIEQIDDDSTDTCKNDSWNNVTDPLTVEMTGTDYGNIGVGETDALEIGELVYIETEYLRVTGIIGNYVTFKRGAGGSTPAAHVDTTQIDHDGAGTEAPTKIPVGILADVGEDAVTPILAATINEEQADGVAAVSLETGTVLLIVVADVGVVSIPTTETGGNLAWDYTATRRGAPTAHRRVFAVAIVPDSEEVTANKVYVPLPFDPSVVTVQCRVTATGAEGGSSSTEHWDGDVIITVAAAGVPAYLELNNDGGSNWDGSDTLYILAIE